MGYGHAQRNLDALKRLTAETVTLLRQLDRLTEEQANWLREALSTSRIERSPTQKWPRLVVDRYPAVPHRTATHVAADPVVPG